MTLPNGHARRLFIGFSFSLVFLATFALLVAHNTEAGPSDYAVRAVEDGPLTIGIPAKDPEQTIKFYKKLGFRDVPGLSGDLDVVSMKRAGTPYILEIWHNALQKPGSKTAGISGISFPVGNLEATVTEMQGKGLCFQETCGNRDGVAYASLRDPNGVNIQVFQR